MSNEQIKKKIITKFQKSGWNEILKGFLNHDGLDEILEKLNNEVKFYSYRFTPPLKTVFNCFEYCPYKELKVVFIYQEPSPFLDCSDGLALSTPIGIKPDKVSEMVISKVNETVYENKLDNLSHNLVRWAKQGVLLLNSSLTTRVEKPGMHHAYIWKDFLAYLFDMLDSKNPDVIYVFIGKEAKKWDENIGDDKIKYYLDHPYGKKEWDCQDVFNKINQHLKEQNKKEIIW